MEIELRNQYLYQLRYGKLNHTLNELSPMKYFGFMLEYRSEFSLVQLSQDGNNQEIHLEKEPKSSRQHEANLHRDHINSNVSRRIIFP